MRAVAATSVAQSSAVPRLVTKDATTREINHRVKNNFRPSRPCFEGRLCVQPAV